MTFEECINKSDFVLTESAMVERLKSEFGITLNKYINHAALIYEPGDILATIYKQYINIAQQYNLPILLNTPTRKVNYESAGLAGYAYEKLLTDAVNHLAFVRNNYPLFKEKIFIGALTGCRGDAYNPNEALNTCEAYKFHKHQVTVFEKNGADYLFAGIMPAITEAIGMAQAMSESELPYIISFMVRKNGCLLDGTSITDAIKIIDSEVSRKPLYFMANCIHPKNLMQALQANVNKDKTVLARFAGIQANASSLSPEELNNSTAMQQESFDEMAEIMQEMKNTFGFKILGGCCGTNQIFLDKLAKKLTTL